MNRSFLWLVIGWLGAALIGCSSESPEALLASAKTYLAQNDSKAAVIQLKNALQQNPDLPEARFLLGKALLDGGNPAGAAIELDKASDLDYPPEQVAPLLARALLAQGQARRVIDTYADTALSTPAAAADLKTSLALAYAAQRNPEKSKAALDAALQANPDHVPALLLRSREFAGERDLDGAFKVLDQALAKAPNDPDVLLWKGDLLYYGKKDETAAIDAYKQLLAVHNDNPTAHARLLTIHLARNDLNAAKAQLEALHKVRPNDPQTKYFDARVAFQSGDLKRAGELTAELQGIAPNNIQVLQLAGAIAFRNGSLVQAEQILGQILQAVPGLEPVRLLLAKTYMRAGDPTRALATVKPLVEGEAPSAGALALAGTAYLQTGDLDHADKLFSRAIKLDPKDARNRTALALTHLSRGKGDAAFGELEAIAESDDGGSADMALIAAHLRRKDFDGALNAIDRLEKKQPGKPLAQNLRGRVQLLQGDFDGARKSFEKAVALDPVYYPAIESLAALDLRDKKPEAARQRLDKLLEREPKNSRALLALAQLRVHAGGKREEVLALINKAIDLNPTEVSPRLALINYDIQTKDFKAALAAAQAADAAVPNTPQLLEALAHSHLAGGDVNQAISTLDKLAALQPNSAQPQLRLAETYMVAKNNDAAEQSLRRALEIEPRSLAAQQKLIALQMAMGKPDAALATARQVQAQRPDAPVGFAYEGDIEASRKNWKAAQAAYQAAQQKRPASDVATKLHSVLRSAGRRGDADGLAAAWLKQHPKDTLFLFYLGNVALSDNDLAGAETRFQQLIKLQPDNAFAHNNLAWTLGTLKHDGALAHAERANTLMPNQPAFMDTWATLLADSGKFKEAIDLQKKVVELQPDAGVFRLNLAKIYIKSGDKALARTELEHLAQLGDKLPAHKEVQKLLADL